MRHVVEQHASKWLPQGDQVALELRLAVSAGDVEEIRRLLHNDPALATARLLGRNDGSSAPLHLVADWPGYFPRGPEIARLLIAAGADQRPDDQPRQGSRPWLGDAVALRGQHR